MFDDTLGQLVEVNYSFDISITFRMFNDGNAGYVLDCGPLDVCATYKTTVRASSVDAAGLLDGIQSQHVAFDFEMHNKGALYEGSNVWNYRPSDEIIFDDLTEVGAEVWHNTQLTAGGSWENKARSGLEDVFCGDNASYTATPCITATIHYKKVTFTYDDAAVEASEPTTLAIFALGMIGLASRRYKKQS
jgi:hypothetical protein